MIRSLQSSSQRLVMPAVALKMQQAGKVIQKLNGARSRKNELFSERNDPVIPFIGAPDMTGYVNMPSYKHMHIYSNILYCTQISLSLD